jgi:hypothetical protein
MSWVLVLWKGWFSGVGVEMRFVLFFLLRGRNQDDLARAQDGAGKAVWHGTERLLFEASRAEERDGA